MRINTNLRYGRVAEVSYCNMRWISTQYGGRCSWSVAIKTWSSIHAESGHLSICCNVACLTFHLPVITGSFQSHQCQSATCSFQSHQRLEECNIPSVRWKSCTFYKVVRWHFSARKVRSRRNAFQGHSKFHCYILIVTVSRKKIECNSINFYGHSEWRGNTRYDDLCSSWIPLSTGHPPSVTCTVTLRQPITLSPKADPVKVTLCHTGLTYHF